MENHEKYSEYSREELVEEYMETELASLINFCDVDKRWMPRDVSKDIAYWKAKNKDLHDMHYEIARRYHIDRDDCLWLQNIVDGDNLYIMDYKFKALVEKAISLLEKQEKEKLNEV